MNAEQKEKIVNLKLQTDGDTGDGKRMFIIGNNNDGWEDLRIEVDTDDVDSDYAKAAAKRVIECVNACAGIADLKSLNPS
jgi:hypothetical protein